MPCSSRLDKRHSLAIGMIAPRRQHDLSVNFQLLISKPPRQALDSAQAAPPIQRVHGCIERHRRASARTSISGGGEVACDSPKRRQITPKTYVFRRPQRCAPQVALTSICAITSGKMSALCAPGKDIMKRRLSGRGLRMKNADGSR